jgi:hypothetical protein
MEPQQQMANSQNNNSTSNAGTTPVNQDVSAVSKIEEKIMEDDGIKIIPSRDDATPVVENPFMHSEKVIEPPKPEVVVKKEVSPSIVPAPRIVIPDPALSFSGTPGNPSLESSLNPTLSASSGLGSPQAKMTEKPKIEVKETPTVIKPTAHTFADDMRSATQAGGAPTPPITIIPEQKKEEKTSFQPEDKVKISPLHTYADDVRGAVQNDGVSMAKIMMAEAKKQEDQKAVEEELSPTSTKNKSIITVSVIVLIVACAGFAGTWYFLNKSKEPSALSVQQQHRISIIPYDEETLISLDLIERKKILEGIASAKKQNYQKDTSIVYLPIMYKGSTSTAQMETDLFLSVFETRASSALLRSFGNEFMLGLNKNNTQASPFMILHSDSFSQMYAGMLEWEPAMADDIGDIFFTKEDLIDPVVPASTTKSVATSTSFQEFIKQKSEGQASSTKASTSTPPVLLSSSSSASLGIGTSTSSSSETVVESEVEQKVFKSRYIIANSLVFKDEVLNNRDMRVLRTVSGKTLMYYTFINDKILLIAKDFVTLDEVVKRLATSQFKQ